MLTVNTTVKTVLLYIIKYLEKKKLNQYITNSKLQDFILLEDLKSNTHNVYVGCKYQIVEK